MHLDTKKVKVYNRKHVGLHVLISTRPKSWKMEIYIATYQFYGEIVYGGDDHALKIT